MTFPVSHLLLFPLLSPQFRFGNIGFPGSRAPGSNTVPGHQDIACLLPRKDVPSRCWTGPEPGAPDLCNHDSVKQKCIFYLQSTLISLNTTFTHIQKPSIATKARPSQTLLISRSSIIQLPPSCSSLLSSPTHPSLQSSWPPTAPCTATFPAHWATAPFSPAVSAPPDSSSAEISSSSNPDHSPGTL